MVNEDSRVHITVVSASNLPAADSNGYSDPYVVIKDVTGLHMHGKKTKTAVKKKTLNPVWDEMHTFTCNYKLHKLVFQVWDHDSFSKDDRIAKGKVCIDFLLDAKPHEIDLPLHNHGKPAGVLKLRLHMELKFPIAVAGNFLRIEETNLNLGLGWEVAKKKALDLDASILALNGNRELVDHAAFDQKNIFQGALQHQGDNRTGEGKGDDENIFINLARIPPNVEYLVFLVHAFTDGASMQSIKSAYVRLMGKDTHAILAYSRVFNTEDKKGLMFGYLRKDPGGWWTFYARPGYMDGWCCTESWKRGGVAPLLFN